MREKINCFLKKDFIKSIFILSGGSLLAQFISFICSMIITRQYPKVDIGYYTYILSIVTMFATVVNGRYDVSIVSAENKKEVFSLVKISFYIMILVSPCVTAGSYIMCSLSKNELGNHRNLVLFVLPLLLVYGIINILNAYNNRYSEYKLISSAYLIRTLFQNIFTLGFGVFKATSFSLLFSQVIGLCLGMKKQSKGMLGIIKEITGVKLYEIKEVLKKYKAQPLLSVPASFINALSYSAISLFIGNYFNMSILAMYSMSVTVLGVPLGIFGSNIAKVHFKEAADEIENSGNYKKTTYKMVIFSAILSGLMVVFLIMFAPSLFGILYGESWVEAGVYVQILAPMFGFRLMVGAVGFGFIIANKQKLELIFQVLLFIGMVIVSAISILLSCDITQFLIVLSICYSVIYAAELIKIMQCSKEKVR